MNNALNYLPTMLTGEELKKALLVLPPYDDSIRNAPTAKRLIELSKLYDVYFPSRMSEEIYCKLYLALLRSLQKKNTKTAVIQGNMNRQHRIQDGAIGGSDSFTLLGLSGIGKSTAIKRVIELIAPNLVIEADNTSKIAPVIIVQTPYDCSVKGLLLEILRAVDNSLDTNYYKNSIRAKATTDTLIGAVANVCLHSVGLLILDEFQNVCGKNGNNLLGVLLNLINASGVSLAMVGTLETKAFFSNATFQLSRRSLGLEYTNLNLDDYFYELCKTFTKYLYVKNDFTLTDEIVNWLYTHSQGITSVVISLIKDAQEIAILDGIETLSVATLNKAYNQRLSLLHNHITLPTIKHTYKKEVISTLEPIVDVVDENYISSILLEIKKNGGDFVRELKQHIEVIEVAI